MAVADAAVKSSPPPPARIAVAVLAFLRFVVLGPMLALERVLLVAATVLPYLGFAAWWGFSASSAASVVAGRAWGEGSAPFVFLEALRDAAFKASICIVLLFIALAAVKLCLLCLAYMIAVASGSGSEFKKSAFGAIRRDWRESALYKFPCAVVLGFVADSYFILLIGTGMLVMVMSSPVDGSVMVDVGRFGHHATYCFVVIPALALDMWRKGPANRKSALTVADC